MAELPELDDIQGNVLHGYGFKHVAHVLLHAETADAARRCLGALADQVTTAAAWAPDRSPRTALNVAVTYSGFERLGVRPSLLALFPEAFRQGPRQRAAALGDIGPSGPEHWDAELGTGDVHLMVTVNAKNEQDLEAAMALSEILGRLPGLERTVDPQVGHALKHKREHFGYADGFGQPDIEGVARRTHRRVARARGGGTPVDDSGWQPLKIGEFVLGYADEDDHVEKLPDPDLIHNGTYVVYRKLKQDVARFRRGLKEAATHTGLPVELVAAKVVGRWRDGMPLELEPHRGPGDLTEEAVVDPPNDFRYLPQDQHGYLCPLGAHIRRANPRDALNFGGAVRDSGKLSARHRIVRRGMPYGDELPPNAEDDRADRGLLFVCFNADIARQFETVQAQWCNDGDAFGLGDDRDYVLGDTGGTGKMTIPIRGGPPLYIDAQPEIVQTRGAEYLFAPGVAALRLLAAGAFD